MECLSPCAARARRPVRVFLTAMSLVRDVINVLKQIPMGSLGEWAVGIVRRLAEPG